MSLALSVSQIFFGKIEPFRKNSSVSQSKYRTCDVILRRARIYVSTVTAIHQTSSFGHRQSNEPIKPLQENRCQLTQSAGKTCSSESQLVLALHLIGLRCGEPLYEHGEFWFPISDRACIFALDVFFFFLSLFSIGIPALFTTLTLLAILI